MHEQLLHYKQTQVQTASPEQLVLMLYDGALKYLAAGRKSLEQGDLESANRALLRVQDILTEFMSNLDPSAGEISDRLMALYRFSAFTVFEAVARRSPERLDPVIQIIHTLRSAWAEMMSQARKTPQAASTAPALGHAAGS